MEPLARTKGETSRRTQDGDLTRKSPITGFGLGLLGCFLGLFFVSSVQFCLRARGSGEGQGHFIVTLSEVVDADAVSASAKDLVFPFQMEILGSPVGLAGRGTQGLHSLRTTYQRALK